MAEEKRRFPTEVVDLPSKGLLYPKDSPLAGGTIELKYMTAKEEDILTTQSYIKQGVVLDKLFQSLIVSNGEGQRVKYSELLIGDKNAIMIAARVLGYGKDYEFTYDGVEQTVDLSTLESVKLDFSKFTKGKNEFNFKLPNSEREITFKLLSGKDEKEIDTEVKAKLKISEEQSSELTTRLKHMILTVDGKSEKSYINNFVDNEFLSRDSLAFRQYLSSITPDVDMTTKVVDSAGKESEVAVPVTVRFFWPSSGI